jgi:hypothetical protein
LIKRNIEPIKKEKKVWSKPKLLSGKEISFMGLFRLQVHIVLDHTGDTKLEIILIKLYLSEEISFYIKNLSLLIYQKS